MKWVLNNPIQIFHFFLLVLKSGKSMEAPSWQTLNQIACFCFMNWAMVTKPNTKNNWKNIKPKKPIHVNVCSTLSKFTANSWIIFAQPPLKSLLCMSIHQSLLMKKLSQGKRKISILKNINYGLFFNPAQMLSFKLNLFFP